MKLPENATLEHAAELAAGLTTEVAKGSGVLHVDASGLRAFDSSTIALLLQARRAAEAAGRGFAVTGVPAQLLELARLYGVDGLLALSSESPGRPEPA
jgi:phospholipid transport system transporter-binding protein